LTYANVMVTILAFVVLAGGTAFAAGQLGKNSVGPKQLKKNAVTAAKIKNNAVTAAKIANGAVSGTKINLASLGTVPSATTATNAGNANTVNGRTITKVFAKIPIGTTGTVATVGPFTLRAECEAGSGDVEDFELLSFGPLADMVGGSIGTEGQSFDQESGTENTLELDEGEGVDNTRGVASFTAALADGTTVSGIVGFDDTKTFSTEESCAFYGHVTS
jgi:hypothetical protein